MKSLNAENLAGKNDLDIAEIINNWHEYDLRSYTMAYYYVYRSGWKNSAHKKRLLNITEYIRAVEKYGIKDWPNHFSVTLTNEEKETINSIVSSNTDRALVEKAVPHERAKENSKNPIYKKWWAWVIVILVIGQIGKSLENPSMPGSSKSDSYKTSPDCSQSSSQAAVRDRFASLGHRILGIQLMSSNGCSYSWLVSCVTRNMQSADCVVNTDGSSGSVVITKVGC